MKFLFWILVILILYPLCIYPISLYIISFFCKKEKFDRYSVKDLPNVSYVVTVYNEENVILKKLENISSLEYPSEKIEYIIASDDSNDKTHEIVEDYMRTHTNLNLKLHIVKGRVGKTIVQNQTRKICKGEIIAFSDANSLWKENSLYWLVSRFVDTKIGYVSGNLQYINSDIDNTAYAESSYWNYDLKIREMESSISNIVGGNGSIYAIRNQYYVDLPPLLSHDGFMPTKMVINGYKAKSEPMAIAFEKASEDSNDEFQRKVRMQRGQPFKKYYDIEKFNIFKYGWFTYFYIGHKYLKYLLYLFHPTLLIVNFYLLDVNIFYEITFYLQLIFYILAIVGYFFKNKKIIILLYIPYHYCLTIVAQIFSIKNTLLGKSKATWEKSKTTRQ